jgi:hypothetical protein
MAIVSSNLPLAFLVALSATTPNAQATLSARTPALLQPGSLRALLDQGASVAGDPFDRPQAQPGAVTRTAQSCIYGYWRRC